MSWWNPYADGPDPEKLAACREKERAISEQRIREYEKYFPTDLRMTDAEEREAYHKWISSFSDGQWNALQELKKRLDIS